MTEGPDGPQGLARDWITIWQSELSAAATDRERGQAWSSMVGLWAEGARAVASLLPASWLPDGPAGPAAREPPPGSASPGHAPDARDDAVKRDARDAIERLAARVAELERRLAG